MLPLQIHREAGKGMSLSDTPRCALQLGFYFCGITLAKLTTKGLCFQLHSTQAVEVRPFVVTDWDSH